MNGVEKNGDGDDDNSKVYDDESIDGDDASRYKGISISANHPPIKETHVALGSGSLGSVLCIHSCASSCDSNFLFFFLLIFLWHGIVFLSIVGC